MESRICTKCSEPKPESEFSLVHPAKMDGRLRPDCKECVRRRTREHCKKNPEMYTYRFRKVHQKAQKAAVEFIDGFLREHCCIDCGETDTDVLDFDHVRGIKVCDLATMKSRGYRLWRIKAEIAKCDIRCANCHRRVTKKRRNAGVVISG